MVVAELLADALEFGFLSVTHLTRERVGRRWMKPSHNNASNDALDNLLSLDGQRQLFQRVWYPGEDKLYAARAIVAAKQMTVFLRLGDDFLKARAKASPEHGLSQAIWKKKQELLEDALWDLPASRLITVDVSPNYTLDPRVLHDSSYVAALTALDALALSRDAPRLRAEALPGSAKLGRHRTLDRWPSSVTPAGRLGDDDPSRKR